MPRSYRRIQEQKTEIAILKQKKDVNMCRNRLKINVFVTCVMNTSTIR